MTRKSDHDVSFETQKLDSLEGKWSASQLLPLVRSGDTDLCVGGWEWKKDMFSEGQRRGVEGVTNLRNPLPFQPGPA